MNRRDLLSLSLVNRLFSDAADIWIWRDVSLRTIPNAPFAPIERRLNFLLGRLDQGKMLTNLQLLYDAYLPEARVEYFRNSVGELLARSRSLTGLTLGGRCGRLEIPPVIDRLSPSVHLVELTFHLRLTPELWDFVFSQPTIRRLVLNYCAGPPHVRYKLPDMPSHIPPNALPQLEALLAPIELVTRLLPGRPVRCVVVQSLDFSAPSAFDLLWQAVELSSTALTALSIRADSAHAFNTLLEILPRRTPYLRFLGVNIAVGHDRRWIPLPTAADLAPLRSLTVLECIRWESRLPLRFNSDPTDYAGPSLRYAQHEFSSSSGAPHKCEGTWETVNKKDRVYWKLVPCFLASRVCTRWQELVCAIICFLI